MVVGGLFRDVTNELCHLRQWSDAIRELYTLLSGPYLDFLLEFPLEAAPDDFPLTRLQTITHGRDGTNIVRHREKDELLVDKIRVRDLIRIVVEVGSRLRVFGERWDCGRTVIDIP